VPGRGEEIPRPNPWTVRAADSQAMRGWKELLSQAPAAMDRVWVEITSDPRRRTERQHQLKGTLGEVTIGDKTLEQWQVEPTGAGRLWYAIDDEKRVLWVTDAGPGHPKQTEPRSRRGR